MNFGKLLRELIKAADGEKAAPARRSTTKRRPAQKKNTQVRRQSTVYTDEMITPPLQRYEIVPAKIKQMRTISGYTMTGQRSMEALFYHQGVFMADYKDNYERAVPCTRTTPMYYNLRDDELRCYFTWRTLYRAGGCPDTELAYLLLYCYEMINIIGVAQPQQGFTGLEDVLALYGDAHPQLKKMIPHWLADYAAYYGIEYKWSTEREQAVGVMMRHGAHTDAEVLAAMNMISGYKVLRSKLYTLFPAETEGAFHAVYAAMMEYYAMEKRQSFPAYLYGARRREAHIMFEGAVFLDRRPDAEYSIRLSPMVVYHCCRGTWAVERYCSEPDGGRIGAFLRTFDSLLREALHVRYSLKPAELPEGDAERMRRAIMDYLAEQAKQNAPVIELDFAKLAEIRAAADHTTEMLTLPGDEPQEALVAGADRESADEKSDAEADETAMPDLPLSTPAMALLLCLLTGESYLPLIEQGHMIGVLTDEINENLYDDFGDTVVEYDGEKAVLIEDYIEEVKGMFAV